MRFLQQACLESEARNLEHNLESIDNLRKHGSFNNDLELIYNHTAEKIRIRSKCFFVFNRSYTPTKLKCLSSQITLVFA